MLGRQERWQEDLFIAAPLRDLIPDDHILKRVDRVLDPSRLRNEVGDLYCPDNTRPRIEPQRAEREICQPKRQALVPRPLSA